MTDHRAGEHQPEHVPDPIEPGVERDEAPENPGVERRLQHGPKSQDERHFQPEPHELGQEDLSQEEPGECPGPPAQHGEEGDPRRGERQRDGRSRKRRGLEADQSGREVDRDQHDPARPSLRALTAGLVLGRANGRSVPLRFDRSATRAECLGTRAGTATRRPLDRDLEHRRPEVGPRADGLTLA
jgi:hypothetical protein